MRPGQNNNSSNNNKNRSRGRNNNGGRKHLNPLSRNYESNGPDVKVRGNAAHVAEKYVQLARDAHASGDSVMAENYLQHAEHYFRIVSAAMPQQRDQFGQEIQSDESEDDDYGGDETADRFEIPQFRQSQPQMQNGDRNNGQQPNGQQSNGQANGEPRQNGEQRSFDRPPREDRQPRFEPVRTEQPRVETPEPAESQEAAPVPVEAAPEAVANAANGDAEPRRVRERRPRRRRPQLGDGQVDPDGPQPDVGDLPAFITAGGSNPAE